MTLPERDVVQKEDTARRESRLSDWESARIFLEVARCGSFKVASERLGQSINLVRKRVDDFERQIGAQLISRDQHVTWRLTEEGSSVVSSIEGMEAAALALMRDKNPTVQPVSREIQVEIAGPISVRERTDTDNGTIQKEAALSEEDFHEIKSQTMALLRDSLPDSPQHHLAYIRERIRRILSNVAPR